MNGVDVTAAVLRLVPFFPTKVAKLTITYWHFVDSKSKQELIPHMTYTPTPGSYLFATNLLDFLLHYFFQAIIFVARLIFRFPSLPMSQEQLK